MNERLERLKKRVMIDHYPICIEKYRITLDVIENNKNDPVILQRAKILDETTKRMPIEIAPDELIVGIGRLNLWDWKLIPTMASGIRMKLIL